MKAGTIAVTALIAVMGLFLTSFAGGQEIEKTDDNTGQVPVDLEFFEEMGDAGLDEDEVPDLYDKIVRRSYTFLTKEFISEHSEWGALPPVKDIFTANSSGRWMYNMLPRINASGEARIIDRDRDGVAELVIWRHVIHDSEIISQNGSVNTTLHPVEMSNISFKRNVSAGFTLFYLDRDDNGIPEIIWFDHYKSVNYVILGRNMTVGNMKFTWNGGIVDRDQDSVHDLQRFTTKRRFRIDLDNDGNMELMKVHRASYSRRRWMGGSDWNVIKAGSMKGINIDLDSDGNPESRISRAFNGLMTDRDGDHLPEEIGLRFRSRENWDRDSDGNPESRKTSITYLATKDRNSDGNPERITAGNRTKNIIDRDSDGNWDVIVVKYWTFKYLDWNSDGRPEMVTCDHGEKIIYPGAGKDDKAERQKDEKVRARPEAVRDEEEEKRQTGNKDTMTETGP